MARTPTTQTHEPLPTGIRTVVVGPACPTCGPREVVFGHDLPDPPRTRSVQPNADGLYVVQYHAEWCPVWTNETPRVAAPRCGAPVTGLSFSPGYVLVVPGFGPNGEPVDNHVEATPEAEAHYATWSTKRLREPFFDRAVLEPCGHEVRDDEARAVAAAVRSAALADWNAEAERVIASHADLLGRARDSGFDLLVNQYWDAVLAGKPEAPGLLAALRALAGDGVG